MAPMRTEPAPSHPAVPSDHGTGCAALATGAGRPEYPKVADRRADHLPLGSLWAWERRQFRWEASGSHRAPVPRRDAQQRFALPHHGRPVLGPVGVFACDRPVVRDQRLHRFWHVHDLGVAVDLHPGAAEVVRQDNDAGTGILAGVAGLRAGGVGGDNETSGLVDAARHRRGLRAAVGTCRDDDGVMTGPDEVEQFISGDHGVRCDLRAHQLTIPSRPDARSDGAAAYGQSQAFEWGDRG